MDRTSVLLAAFFVGSVGLVGCGNDGTVEVTGTVTLDGKPLDDAQVIFLNEDRTAAGSGQISEGEFEFNVKPGSYKVEILASREVPGKTAPPEMGGGPISESIIPARYNYETELTATVGTDEEANAYKFDLTSEGLNDPIPGAQMPMPRTR